MAARNGSSWKLEVFIFALAAIACLVWAIVWFFSGGDPRPRNGFMVGCVIPLISITIVLWRYPNYAQAFLVSHLSHHTLISLIAWTVLGIIFFGGIIAALTALGNNLMKEEDGSGYTLLIFEGIMIAILAAFIIVPKVTH